MKRRWNDQYDRADGGCHYVGSSFDSRQGILRAWPRSQRRPCVSPGLLSDFQRFLESTAQSVEDEVAATGSSSLHHLVISSKTPEVFNLGGDLEHFQQLVLANNRRGLMDYARGCVDVVYQLARRFPLSVTTVALVQGDALGGGFETALACDCLIAESSAKLGLPEVLFDLFPGMGAYSFLSRRLDPAQAERIILSGKIYTARELYELGVVDILAADGKGEVALQEYVRNASRCPNAHQAMKRIQRRYNAVPYEELLEIATFWVDAALRLDKRSLRAMGRLVKAQDRRLRPPARGSRQPPRNNASTPSHPSHALVPCLQP